MVIADDHHSYHHHSYGMEELAHVGAAIHRGCPALIRPAASCLLCVHIMQQAAITVFMG
jgi:hypothetical protein